MRFLPTSLTACLVALAVSLPAATVDSFTLINATSDTPVPGFDPIADNANIDFVTIGSSNFNIRANVSGTPGTNINFNLSGAESHTQSEGAAPYALFGDSSGNYANWTPTIGSYSLSGTVDSNTTTINFTVTNAGSGGGSPSALMAIDDFPDYQGGGTGDGVYEEAGGMVIMEMENTASPYDLWVKKTSVAGYTGSGYLEFTGNSPTNGPARSPLEFEFKINQAGLYYLNLHCSRETVNGRTDLANDGYVRVEGDYGAGPNAGNNHGDDAPLNTLKKDTKFFGGNNNQFVWASGNRLDLGGHDNKRVAVYDFKAGETYKFVISGRSQLFKVNRILFKHIDVKNGAARNLDNPESTQGDGSGGGFVPYYRDTGNGALAIDASVEANRSGFAQATTTWTGSNGTYDVTITTLTEEDGESTYQLFVNDVQVGTYQNPYIGPGSAQDLEPNTHTWEDIELTTGDTIAVRSNADTNGEIPEGSGTAWARGRWRSLEMATALSDDDGDGSVVIAGDLMQWHRVDVIQSAVFSGEMADPNPFLNYRYNVTFTSPSGDVRVVPGYFATDNNGADQGNKWVAHLNPHETGTWSYDISFRSGNNVAVSLANAPGSAVSPFDGVSGTFLVGASDKSGDDFRAPSKGMLTNEGNHYLTYGGSGKPFVYTGPGIPENILGYRGFTNTTEGVGHEFEAHNSDWNAGDPNWPDPGTGFDGKNLIGALNYIAEQGGNALYMMSNTIQGDGNDCFPHPTSSGNKDRYDLLKLHQWDLALAHAQAKGIFLHWHLAEHESGNMNYYGSSAMTNNRRLAFRMLNARFGHYNGLKWNIMEECEWNASERAEQMKFLKDIDPYNHPVTWQAGGAGLPRGDAEENYGDPNMDAGSFQGSPSRNAMFNEVVQYREGSVAAGVPWTVAWDEPQRVDNTIDYGQSDNNLDRARYDKMWPCMMAGGDGFMWYIRLPGGSHGYDQRIEDFNDNGMAVAWNWSGYVRDFLEPLPLLDMVPSQSVVSSSSGNDYALYKAGEIYAIFNDRAGSGMTLDLNGEPGTYDVQWFDPRNGGALQSGSVATVSGGGVVNLGDAPNTTGSDWAVLVTLQGVEFNLDPAVSFITPSDGDSFSDSATVGVEVTASDSDGTIARIDLFVNGALDSSDNSAPYSWSLTGLGEGTHTLRVVAYDNDGATAEAIIEVTVSAGVVVNTRQISLTIADGFVVDIVPTTATSSDSSSGGDTTHTFGDLDPTADHTLEILPGGSG